MNFTGNFSRAGLAVSCFAFSLLSISTALGDYRLQVFKLPQPAKDLSVDENGSGLIATLKTGAIAGVSIREGRVTLKPIKNASAIRARMPGELPDSLLAIGSRDVAAAWLIAPTTRYGHGVLGDAVEAGGIALDLKKGGHHKYLLPDDSVFEDLQPRIADLDGDGVSEVISVRSYQDTGAALAVLGFKKGVFQIISESPAIGTSNRWLNPVGVGDVDGDGKVEVAYVETPHIGGTVYVYRLENRRLVKVYAQYGFSNHAIGSRLLGLSRIADLNGDGIAELIVPDQSRDRLRIFDFAKGKYRPLATLRLSSEIASDLRISSRDGQLRISFLLANGGLAQLSH